CVAITARDGWASYTEDHLALLRHLGIARCHVMGACIGVSFALSLAQAVPGLVTSMVLQNPIGLADNRVAMQDEFDRWAAQIAGRAPWKGPQQPDAAMRRALSFFRNQQPKD